ncbi:hypothetical protein AQJ11_39075 [Streptomyces corchorusii]|uniref:Uncharacterized protein n=1 Tax=Streptomyces corchorusii TaxID=1903 RepID=A0A117QA01_STRCK|nr:hypothetical protein AQJ11_39075 [Streptomyces corchorusii]
MVARHLTPTNNGGGTSGRKRLWRPSRTRSASATEPHTAPAVHPDERHDAPTADLTVRRVGGTWLVHPAAGPDRQSQLFAAGVATDPEYALVVVDLPRASSLDAVEEVVARAVPAGPRGLRVIFGRPPKGGVAAAGRLLARRLALPVVVPDGVLRPSAGGALFIGADRGQGWVLCTPEGQVEYLSRRFPQPKWDESLPNRPRAMGRSAVAEPMPAGVWLRPVLEDAAQHRHRGHLAARLRGRSDAATVVIGTPGAPVPETADIGSFWRSLPEDTAAALRVVPYGVVHTPGDRSFGDTLAALTGEPVHVYNGFPTGDPLVGLTPREDVVFLGEGGELGRPVFARELLYLPPEPDGSSHPALAVDHRWPLEHLPMLRQGLYRGGNGMVLEVLPWGLWIRPSAEPWYADEVRATHADPHHELILCDDSLPEKLPQLQRLAEDVLRRLPAQDGLLVRVLTASRPWGATALRSGPKAPAALAPAVGHGTLPGPGDGQDEREGQDGCEEQEAGEGREAPTARAPSGAAGSPEDEAVVARALRHDPGLGRGLPDETAFAGLLSVRRRLTVHAWCTGQNPNDAGAGAPAAADPAALAALALLPAYEGVVALRTHLDPAAIRWYRQHRVATAHYVCAASLTGTPGKHGDADVLIRSITGRRTALLEPELPDRVLFPPGTQFEVLHVHARPGESTVVMLDERPPADERRSDRARRAAVRELMAALRVWRQDEMNGVVRDLTPDPFARPPGPEGPDGPGRPSDATGRASARARSAAGERPDALSGRFR